MVRYSFALMFCVALIGCSSDVATPPVVDQEAETSSIAKVTDDPAVAAVLEESAENVRRDADGWIIDVDFRGKQISASGLEPLTSLEKLRAVRLAGTGIDDGGLEVLGEITSLEDLDLRDCPVTDAGLANLSDLPKLKALRLSGKSGNCPVTDDGMKHIGKIKTLKVLALDYLWISEVGLADLKDLTSLQELYLAGTTIGNEAIEVIGQYPDLKKLRLAANQIDGQGLAALPTLSNLEELDLSECLQISDADTKPLGELKKLKDLNLWRVNISDEGIAPIGQLSALEELNLDNTRLSDAGMPVLSGLTNLTFLHLGSTGITDAGLAQLGDLQKLKKLIVTRTAVTADGVEELQHTLSDAEIQLEYVAGK